MSETATPNRYLAINALLEAAGVDILTPEDKMLEQVTAICVDAFAWRGWQKALDESNYDGLPLVSATSEASTAREILAPFCVGPRGLDIGGGGDLIVSHATLVDQKNPYTKVGNCRQILQGDCRSLHFICNDSQDWIHSAHLLEDFSYETLAAVIIPEWRRVLKQGGLLITNCPDQQKFLAHCAATGQGINCAHLEADFSLHTFKTRVLAHTGEWETVLEVPEHGAYSWLLVCKKVGL